ncbi:MAG: VCBS repeat-containing protein, partial [Phycisphaerales bacterium]|nr:VCBS repeat-containing protein [Phycisphaerales bacterium]
MSMHKTLALVSVAGLASLASAQIAFQAPLTLPTAQNPSGAAIGDFNGDGNPDLAVTVDNQDRILTFLGDGNGGLAPGATVFLGAGVGAGAIVSADFDGDGDD